MAHFTYNGVSMPFCMHTNFSQEPVYDELGSTDRMYTKFDIAIQAVLNTAYNNDADSTQAANADLPTFMKNLRAKLMTPRRQLSVTVAGTELIPDPISQSQIIDARNGPFPQSCQIIKLTNTTFLITFRIIAHYCEFVDNGDSGSRQSSGSGVVSNRWTETIEVDTLNYTRYNRDGKFFIRSDNDQHFTADQFRENFAFLGLSKGFKRISSKYTISPDGLALAYSIVDQEIWLQPPEPAWEAEGEYVETLSNLGAVRVGHVRVHLKGAKETPQEKLIEAAVAVCGQKLRAAGAQTKQNAQIAGKASISFLRTGAVRVDLYRNEVEVQLEALMKSDSKLRLAGAADLNFDNLTGTPLSPPDGPYRPPYQLFGNLGVEDGLLHAASYYDPSLTQNVLSNLDNQMHPGKEPGEGSEK